MNIFVETIRYTMNKKMILNTAPNSSKYFSLQSILLVLLLSCTFAFAQGDSKHYNFDFNEDSIADELVVNYFIGTLDFASFTDGATKKQYKLLYQRQENKQSMIKITPIPLYFLSEKGERALPKIDSLLFSIPLTKKADQSLLWLLDNYLTKTKSSNKYFSSHCTFQSAWLKEKPILPANYRLMMSDSMLVKALYKTQQITDSASSTYITYLGKFHASAISLNRNDVNAVYPIKTEIPKKFTLYQSAHGIYIKKDSMYAWIFVSDGALYNNIQKLEWESIIDIKTYNDYVIVLNQPYPAIQNSIFIVDWKRGKMVELNRENILSAYPNLRYMESIEVTENYLYIFAKNKPSSDDLREIKIDLRLVLEEMLKL
jgi:hypothetical protein